MVFVSWFFVGGLFFLFCLVFLGSIKWIVLILYYKLWEGGVVLPVWIVTIHQSCTSHWESPHRFHSSTNTNAHLTIILLTTQALLGRSDLNPVLHSHLPPCLC